MKSGTGFTNVKLRGQAQTENINNVVTVRIQMELKFAYGKKWKMKHPAEQGGKDRR